MYIVMLMMKNNALGIALIDDEYKLHQKERIDKTNYVPLIFSQSIQFAKKKKFIDPHNSRME